MWQVVYRIPIGPDGIPVYGFGMMLFLAFVACTWLASRRAELEGISREIVQDIAVWLFLGGLIGARLTFIITETKLPPDLGAFLAEVPRFWESKSSLAAAFLGGAIASAFGYAQSRREDPRTPPKHFAAWLFLGALLSARLSFLFAQNLDPITDAQRILQIWEEGTAPFSAVIAWAVMWAATTLLFRFRPRAGSPRFLPCWVLVTSILACRLTDLFAAHPDVWSLVKSIPMIWEGGIVLYGSLLGGTAAFFLALALVYHKRGLRTLPFIDAIAPSIAIGIAIGRVGCLLNGCCYGQVACAECPVPLQAHFPLSAPCREVLVMSGVQTAAGFTFAEGVRIGAVDPASPAYEAGLRPGAVLLNINGRPARDNLSLSNSPRGQTSLTLEYEPRPGGAAETITIYPRTVGLYPTQMYETVSMALLLLVLLAYYPFRSYPGQVMAVMMIGYGIHRYLNEILRDDPRPEGFENYGSLVAVAGGVLLWVGLWIWSRSHRAPVTHALPPEPVETTGQSSTPALGQATSPHG